MDATGSYRASRDADDVLKRLYLDTHPEAAGAQLSLREDFKEWLARSLSGYSFVSGSLEADTTSEFAVVNPAEAVANAFAHVELDPATASAAEKALHELLIDSHTMEIDDTLRTSKWRGTV